jgi:predicted RNase H-related nuclease YkuK (DUF458 family)
MFEDLSKTIKAQLYERVRSPLLSSFAMSWAGWNYKFLLVAFSAMTSPEKLLFIETNVFPTTESVLMNGVAYPLLTALALIFIYPIPAKYIYEYSRKRQRELKKIQQRIDDETPLTREEAREVRKEALRAMLDLETELEKRRNETQRLKELVTSMEEQIARGTAFQKDASVEASRAAEKRRNETQRLKELVTEEQIARDATLQKNAPVKTGRTSGFTHKRLPSKTTVPNYENSRVLLPPDQYVHESLKNFLMNEEALGDMKFMIEVRDGKVSISRLPAKLPGDAKLFQYDFNVNSKGNNIISEIERIKQLIIRDSTSGSEPNDNIILPPGGYVPVVSTHVKRKSS